MNLYQPTITGSLSVSGSVNISGSITIAGGGTISGTSSYATNAELLDGLDSTVFTLTSSFAAQTASFTAFTASILAQTASLNTFSASVLSYTSSLNAKTSSFATTGSNTFEGIQTINSNLIVTGSITAQTLVVQTVTSSVIYSSGSNVFGNAIGNTQVMTGSLLVTGSSTFSGNIATTGNITIQKTAPNILMKGGYAQDLGFFLNNEPAVYLVDDATATKGMKVNISTGAITQLGSGSVSFTGALTGTSAAFTTTSGLGVTITTNDIATLKMTNSAGTTKNWGFATTNLVASDFGIYQSTSNGGDPITAGSAKLYFNGSGAATFNSSITATSATFSGSLSVTGASTFISPIEVAARFMTNGDGTIIIGGTAAQGASSGEQYITYQNYTTDTNAWMVGMDDGEDFRWGYGAQGEISNANTLMKISQAGNVGIGTITPYVIAAGGPCLDLRGPTWSFIELGTSSTVSGSNDIGYLEFMNGNNTRLATIVGATDGTALAGAMRFSTANSSGAFTERMRITSGGYTKISNTAEYANAARYHELRSNNTADETVVVTNTSSTTTYGILVKYPNSDPNNTGSHPFYFETTAGGQRMSIKSNGGIYNYSANNVNLSDISTKKDIILCESYWDKFKAIEIVKFKYKDQTHDDYNIGVIAQQVEQVAPEFIDEENWAKEGEEPKILKAIYTEDLHNATIKVLQEAMGKIESLQAEFDAYKTTHP